MNGFNFFKVVSSNRFIPEDASLITPFYKNMFIKLIYYFLYCFLIYLVFKNLILYSFILIDYFIVKFKIMDIFQSSLLTKEKILSLLVEGGANIFDQFIKENLFDEIIIIRSKENFGDGIKPENLNIISQLKKYSSLNLGGDELELYKKY